MLYILYTVARSVIGYSTIVKAFVTFLISLYLAALSMKNFSFILLCFIVYAFCILKQMYNTREKNYFSCVVLFSVVMFYYFIYVATNVAKWIKTKQNRTFMWTLPLVIILFLLNVYCVYDLQYDLQYKASFVEEILLCPLVNIVIMIIVNYMCIQNKNVCITCATALTWIPVSFYMDWLFNIQMYNKIMDMWTEIGHIFMCLSILSLCIHYRRKTSFVIDAVNSGICILFFHVLSSVKIIATLKQDDFKMSVDTKCNYFLWMVLSKISCMTIKDENDRPKRYVRRVPAALAAFLLCTFCLSMQFPLNLCAELQTRDIAKAHHIRRETNPMVLAAAMYDGGVKQLTQYLFPRSVSFEYKSSDIEYTSCIAPSAPPSVETQVQVAEPVPAIDVDQITQEIQESFRVRLEEEREKLTQQFKEQLEQQLQKEREKIKSMEEKNPSQDDLDDLQNRIQLREQKIQSLTSEKDAMKNKYNLDMKESKKQYGIDMQSLIDKHVIEIKDLKSKHEISIGGLETNIQQLKAELEKRPQFETPSQHPEYDILKARVDKLTELADSANNQKWWWQIATVAFSGISTIIAGFFTSMYWIYKMKTSKLEYEEAKNRVEKEKKVKDESKEEEQCKKSKKGTGHIMGGIPVARGQVNDIWSTRYPTTPINTGPDLPTNVEHLQPSTEDQSDVLTTASRQRNTPILVNIADVQRNFFANPWLIWRSPLPQCDLPVQESSLIIPNANKGKRRHSQVDKELITVLSTTSIQAEKVARLT